MLMISMGMGMRWLPMLAMSDASAYASGDGYDDNEYLLAHPREVQIT